MIEKFTVTNFLSFKSKFTLNLKAENISELDGNLLTPTYMKYSMLKGVGIFGNNSSGKTNLFKALSFMKQFVLGKLGGVEREEIDGLIPFKLFHDSERNPSEFEIIFWLNEKRIRFGFLITNTEIIEEWLYTSSGKKETNIYLRVQEEFKVNRGYKKKLEKFSGLVRPNELFITFAARLNQDFAEEILSWFRKTRILIEFNARDLAKETIKKLEDQNLRLTIESIVKNSGFGIESIILKNIGHTLTLKTKRKVLDENQNWVAFKEFDLLEEESLGTIKFFGLIGPILESIKNGSLLVIDEFDAGFHTLLAQHLIRLFQSVKHENSAPQLIFSSHNQDLWDKKVLRRDQQLHMEKDEFQSSFSKSTYDFNLRKDKSVKRSYDKKKLGKLPLLISPQLTFKFKP